MPWNKLHNSTEEFLCDHRIILYATGKKCQFTLGQFCEDVNDPHSIKIYVFSFWNGTLSSRIPADQLNNWIRSFLTDFIVNSILPPLREFSFYNDVILPTHMVRICLVNEKKTASLHSKFVLWMIDHSSGSEGHILFKHMIVVSEKIPG